MTLGFKGLDFEKRPTAFTQISKALDGTHKTLPILIDGETTISQSLPFALILKLPIPTRRRFLAVMAARKTPH
jgi:hypothetical protein